MSTKDAKTDQLPEPSILATGQDWWVINKPAGWVTNRAQTHQEPTLQAWLEENLLALKNLSAEKDWRPLLPDDWDEKYGGAEEIFMARSGLAHRLDKETSGAMLVAKNPGALMNFLAQFKNRQIKKTYWALTHGLWGIKRDRLSLPLGRKSGERLKWTVRAEGKPAVTNYQVLEEWPAINIEKLKQAAGGDLKTKTITNLYQGFSLIECHPQTGRTHQIRVHCSYSHHPLVGDKTYTSSQKIKIDQFWCPRQFLHARSLTFSDPSNHQLVTVESPLAPDLKEALGFLEK